MYMPINSLGYSCIKKLQRDNLWHAYNEPINFYSASLPGEVNKCNDAVNGLPLFTNCVLLTGVICTKTHVDSAI